MGTRTQTAKSDNVLLLCWRQPLRVMEHSFITSHSQASLTKSATNQREHWQLRIKNRERYRTFPHDQSIFRIFHHRIEVLFLLYSLLPRILLVDCEVKQKNELYILPALWHDVRQPEKRQCLRSGLQPCDAVRACRKRSSPTK